MAEAKKQEGDPKLRELFETYEGHLVSPGGAAALLGLSRKTIHTLGEREDIRIFRSDDEVKGRMGTTYGPKWVLIPLVDLRDYAERVGRPFPELPLGKKLPLRKP